MGSCGLAAGAGEVCDFLAQHIKDIPIVGVGCIGHCYAEPIVEVETDTGSHYYAKVAPKKEFVDKILSGDTSGTMVFQEKRLSKELLKVTKLAGKIDPVSLQEYIDNGGYKALEKAKSMARDAIVEEVKKSGLRGRGGGGFPTGLKWSFIASKNSKEKVIICNADEGDPGAFMDRSLMESIPHQVLEGMLITALATDATQIYIYCRAEYPLAIKNLKIAIEQIEKNGINKFKDRTVPIRIKEGAGAFVCGEETALIASLEGGRGTPRLRPPYPADQGFKGYPTSVNNVETFANVPVIILEGGDAYASVGTEKSKGTKLFALAGDLQNPGLVEVPMGVTLGEVVYDIGGSPKGSVKAVQTGGPSGGCIPENLFDTPIDYDSLKSLGAIMGSGGLIAIGKNRCMVETARYFLEFTARESCGKCTFCRIGTKRMLEILERITKGEGQLSDLDLLADLGNKIVKGSLCGLGQTAPNPVLATLRYYRDEYLKHVVDHQCEARECNALVDIVIDHEKCIECKLCIKTCPVSAISETYTVNNSVCTRCNSCIEVCAKKAIYRDARGGHHG
ncbi:MAG: 4Fe-4S binding protein [Oligoflexales bacterium]|nr:4Fe-4S binding protein [Oligoflexales bacterium]